MNIAIFTNILNPYRTSFFEHLSIEAERIGDVLRVFAMVDEKKDRPWKYSDYERAYTRLLPSRTIYSKYFGFIHFNPTVVKELKAFRPDVVVMAGSYLQPTNHTIIRWARQLGYKTVFWSESHFDEIPNCSKLKLYIREKVRKCVLRKMDAFWYPGEKAKLFVDHYGKSTARKIQVPNTINDVFIQKEHFTRLFKKHDKTVLFTPARLTEAKGIIPFIEILKHIPPELYCWKIAGEGPLYEQIMKSAKDTGCNLILLGQKNQEEILDLYSEADVFLLPSIYDPNPLTCIEALWMGLPLFVSENVGNNPEVVLAGKNGFVFSYNNPNDAITKLSDLINSDTGWFLDASSYSLALARGSFNTSIVANKALAETRSI